MATEPLSTPQAAGSPRIERVFRRFTWGQRWEHGLLILSFTVLLLTGLPQKYYQNWGYLFLTTPERLNLVRYIHHIAAILLTLEAIYHVVHGLVLMARHQLSASIFPNMQDVRDAFAMIQYLLFLRKKPPEAGKYNFEQKITYWFLFIGIGIMIVTGFILWFPLIWTTLFPGSIVPTAHLAHSSEAIVAAVFVVIWHFYHVHIERLNVSIFTGRLSERGMRRYHEREYERILATEAQLPAPPGEKPGTEKGGEP